MNDCEKVKVKERLGLEKIDGNVISNRHIRDLSSSSFIENMKQGTLTNQDYRDFFEIYILDGNAVLNPFKRNMQVNGIKDILDKGVIKAICIPNYAETSLFFLSLLIEQIEDKEEGFEIVLDYLEEGHCKNIYLFRVSYLLNALASNLFIGKGKYYGKKVPSLSNEEVAKGKQFILKNYDRLLNICFNTETHECLCDYGTEKENCSGAHVRQLYNNILEAFVLYDLGAISNFILNKHCPILDAKISRNANRVEVVTKLLLTGDVFDNERDRHLITYGDFSPYDFFTKVVELLDNDECNGYYFDYSYQFYYYFGNPGSCERRAREFLYFIMEDLSEKCSKEEKDIFTKILLDGSSEDQKIIVALLLKNEEIIFNKVNSLESDYYSKNNFFDSVSATARVFPCIPSFKNTYPSKELFVCMLNKAYDSNYTVETPYSEIIESVETHEHLKSFTYELSEDKDFIEKVLKTTLTKGKNVYPTVENLNLASFGIKNIEEIFLNTGCFDKVGTEYLALVSNDKSNKCKSISNNTIESNGLRIFDMSDFIGFANRDNLSEEEYDYISSTMSISQLLADRRVGKKAFKDKILFHVKEYSVNYHTETFENILYFAESFKDKEYSLEMLKIYLENITKDRVEEMRFYSDNKIRLGIINDESGMTVKELYKILGECDFNYDFE